MSNLKPAVAVQLSEEKWQAYQEVCRRRAKMWRTIAGIAACGLAVLVLVPDGSLSQTNYILSLSAFFTAAWLGNVAGGAYAVIARGGPHESV